MVLRDNPQSRDATYDLSESFFEAIKPANILRRVFLFLIFGVILALRTLVSNLDNVGRMGGGFFDYFRAITSAMWEGVWLTLGSIWSVIINPEGYMATNSYGSIGFVIFSLIVLILFFFQPVSLFMNIIDGQRGQANGVPLRLAVTLILIIILSCIIYYTGSGVPITSTLPTINETINQTINQTIQNGGSVIDLI